MSSLSLPGPSPSQLRHALSDQGRLDRRWFLAYAGSLTAASVLAERAMAGGPAGGFADDPFSLGVASGDPTPDGMVLWTRLAPKPLDPDGGMRPEPVDVVWEVAADDAFQHIVKRGTAVALPQLAHAVHVEVEGLEPGRWYAYRFRCGDAESPIGRTRTMPAAAAAPEALRFAFASCQNYETGYFTAYRHMAEQSPDLVFHLGDYIYEKSRKSGVRPHDNEPELATLADYRRRHSTYRSDPLLQQMHAACPWMVTWDDHEFDNNYAAGISEEEGIDPAEFLLRRANAYQAYYEMMPLRRQSLPKGPDMRLYRRCGFGRLAEFLVLDTRQYRSDQPNGDKKVPLNGEAAAASNTLLGDAQRGWLASRLVSSPARWNVLAQQVMMGVVDRVAGAEEGFSMDQWPGYLAERKQLLEFCQQRRVANPVVLTGDIHSNWVNDLRSNDRDPQGPVIGTEFVGTSISSFGDGVEKPSNLEALLAENPGLRWHNAERGYVMCTVTPQQWQSDYWTITSVTRPDGEAVLRKSFVVEDGQAGAVEA